MIAKITSAEYTRFVIGWDKGEYPNQRFGQAFINEFFPKLRDPDLWNMEDLAAADLIFKKYVEG